MKAAEARLKIYPSSSRNAKNDPCGSFAMVLVGGELLGGAVWLLECSGE